MAQAADPTRRIPTSRSRRTARARVRASADRLARLVVRAGAFAVIASILGILLFLVWEIVPLAAGADVEPEPGLELAARADALIVDEHRTHLATLGSDGVARVYALGPGELAFERQLADAFEHTAAPMGEDALVGLDPQGRAHFVPVRFDVEFRGDVRHVVPTLEDGFALDLEVEAGGASAFAARRNDEGATAVAQVADGALVLAQRRVERNEFLGTEEIEVRREVIAQLAPLARLELDPTQRLVYGATRSGELLWWDLEGQYARTSEAVPSVGDPVTALALLNGGRALAVGSASGSVSVWFLVRDDDGAYALRRIHDFLPLENAVVHLAPSQRGRTFLAAGGTGELGLYYSTSQRTLWTGGVTRGDAALRDVEPSALVIAPKGDSAFVASGDWLARLSIDNDHPEISFGSLFGKVWYEGASEPAYVWQSTGGTDEFEPKLSLVPLLIGTLKGTLYSLLLAIPLAVLGAMYTSQFMHPSLQRWVKPTVELMASLPSVVLGFLAGLWLAPRIERVFPALILMSIGLPLLIIAAGFVWGALPAGLRRRFRDGTEVFWLVVVIAFGIGLFMAVGPAFEGVAFGGSFAVWLLEVSGLRYDQRNAIVVGLAMGFAVIPIIFAIAEDAFSNVPAELTAGSRAMGATRLQTVLNVVLPTASPGIFSGIMIGFGRAVGETMIVLMATGNTPLLDWNPFNGFRTLSANIAVEIPEAPVGGTLYRTLFVAALLLFILTFALNTIAELVRHRLREKYARL